MLEESLLNNTSRPYKLVLRVKDISYDIYIALTDRSRPDRVTVNNTILSLATSSQNFLYHLS